MEIPHLRWCGNAPQTNFVCGAFLHSILFFVLDCFRYFPVAPVEACMSCCFVSSRRPVSSYLTVSSHLAVSSHHSVSSTQKWTISPKEMVSQSWPSEIYIKREQVGIDGMKYVNWRPKILFQLNHGLNGQSFSEGASKSVFETRL